MKSQPLPPAFKLLGDRRAFTCRTDLAEVLDILQSADEHLWKLVKDKDLGSVYRTVSVAVEVAQRSGARSADLALLEHVAGELESCATYCYCEEDAWNEFMDEVDDALEDLSSFRWAASSGPERDGPFRPDEWFAARHPGSFPVFSTLFLKWDGMNTLTATMASKDFSTSFTCRLLTSEYIHAQELWIDDGGNAAPGRDLLEHSETLVATANKIALLGSDSLRYVRYGAIIKDLADAGFGQLDPAVQEIVSQLSPEWQGSLDELLEAAPELAK